MPTATKALSSRSPKRVLKKRSGTMVRVLDDFIQMIDEELLYKEYATRLKHADDSSRWVSFDDAMKQVGR